MSIDKRMDKQFVVHMVQYYLALKRNEGTSLVAQRFRVCTCNAEGTGSDPGWRAKLAHAVWHSQKREKENITFFGNQLIE